MLISTNYIQDLVNLFQVDLQLQQSFHWYISNEGDTVDSQVLLSNGIFSQLNKIWPQYIFTVMMYMLNV